MRSVSFFSLSMIAFCFQMQVLASTSDVTPLSSWYVTHTFRAGMKVKAKTDKFA